MTGRRSYHHITVLTLARLGRIDRYLTTLWRYWQWDINDINDMADFLMRKDSAPPPAAISKLSLLLCFVLSITGNPAFGMSVSGRP
ncbi:hypothetical protein F4774DRAFT_365324 [Daldinia eschscholtzii]|nr:hypothetical protein F4774DRAFT_365324 [Daldinia eschscholtzii]